LGAGAFSLSAVFFVSGESSCARTGLKSATTATSKQPVTGDEKFMMSGYHETRSP
jgi:hypothetical protein